MLPAREIRCLISKKLLCGLAPGRILRVTKPLTLLHPFECVTGSQSFDIMANTKSAIKAARKSKRLHDRNQGVKTRLKTLRKSFDTAVKANDAAAAKTSGIAFMSAMDKATKSGVVHKNAVARAKSHVAKYVQAK